MLPDPRWGELPALLDAAERCVAEDDFGGVARLLGEFDLALAERSADDLRGAPARELHARVGRLLDQVGEARTRVLAELAVVRRTRGYGSTEPAIGHWIEDRA